MNKLIMKIASSADGGLIGAMARNKKKTLAIGAGALGLGAVAANGIVDHIGDRTGADFLSDNSKKIVAGTGLAGAGLAANKFRKIIKEDEESRDYSDEKNWRWR